MKKRMILNGILMLVVMVWLGGCTRNVAYRTDFDLCRSADAIAECRTSSLQEVLDPNEGNRVDYLLGFVEFDDQGQLFDRGQMNAVINELSERSSSQDFLMLVFVHGWKHNAAEGDDNVAQFRKILHRLSLTEQELAPPGKARLVVGVYLGWRGKSLGLGPLANLTFWDRKNTAHKVGHGGVAEVLTRLDSVRAVDQRMAGGPGQGRTRLVIVGHSFGGAVVYSALGQILMERFVDIKGVADNPAGFGDLVVLINPAFEALRFSPLHDMASDRKTYFPGQRPILAIMTSEADKATKYAFPLGRAFSTFWELERGDEEDANRTAVGHYKPYHTHFLKASPMAEMPAMKADIRAELQMMPDQWASGGDIPFPGSVLEPLGTAAPLNPYPVIYVDKKIIHDHNDIYGEALVEFLRHFILYSLGE